MNLEMLYGFLFCMVGSTLIGLSPFYYLKFSEYKKKDSLTKYHSKSRKVQPLILILPIGLFFLVFGVLLVTVKPFTKKPNQSPINTSALEYHLKEIKNILSDRLLDAKEYQIEYDRIRQETESFKSYTLLVRQNKIGLILRIVSWALLFLFGLVAFFKFSSKTNKVKAFSLLGSLTALSLGGVNLAENISLLNYTPSQTPANTTININGVTIPWTLFDQNNSGIFFEELAARIAPFERGFDSITTDSKKAFNDCEPEKEIVDEINKRLADNYVLGFLLIQGGIDKTPLTKYGKKKFTSNVELAQRRAIWVVNCLLSIKEFKQKLEGKVIIISSAPKHIGKDATEPDMAKDRFVKAYAVWRKPSKGSSDSN